MDHLLARRLDKDPKLESRLIKLARQYLKLGYDSTYYWSGEWDYAHDMLMAYAPTTSDDFKKLEKGHPKNFILPVTATQVATMTTYISQVLFGDVQPHKVEGRGPEDEEAATHINTLLRWNAEQQPTYLLGYLWVQDALTFNRGVFYNSWSSIFKPRIKEVEVTIEDEKDKDGNPFVYTQNRVAYEEVGGYARGMLVSPYDWVCDPTFPVWRFQEGRFAGHRTKFGWFDLKNRSRLPIDHPNYVRPTAVARLKEQKKANPNSPASHLESLVSETSSARNNQSTSRTYYERQRVSGGVDTNSKVETKDPGNISGSELWVKLVPADYGIHDGTDPVVFQFLIGNDDVLLAVNEIGYEHAEFPYSVAEGRPHGHFQFSPSWAFMLKGLQDHIDYLKNRHQEALQRTVGNVFVVNEEFVDVEDFLDPEKEGLIITLKPGAGGRNINEVFQQIPIKDLTDRFNEEAQLFINYSENVTGANNYMQGSPGDAGSATEFAGTQQMAAGRMSAIARLLSVQGLVPQTKQFVTMFQQFLDEPQRLRFDPEKIGAPAHLQGLKSLEISRDTIQGMFDFVAHDGTLPNGDVKKVAALTKVLQSAAAFPQVFQPAPGNLDPRALILSAARAAGLRDIEQFFYQDQAQMAGPVMGQVQLQTGITPEGVIPPQQSSIPFNTPGPSPMGLGQTETPVPTLESVLASQPRPETF